MKGILVDVNIEGYFDRVVAIMQAEPWKIFWDHLGLKYVHFADIGLEPEARDKEVWETCQKLELLLVTDNRNKDSADSLEATIRQQNNAAALPVFTIGDVRRLRHERSYTDRVIESLLQYLQEADNIRGTGRLFLP